MNFYKCWCLEGDKQLYAKLMCFSPMTVVWNAAWYTVDIIEVTNPITALLLLPLYYVLTLLHNSLVNHDQNVYNKFNVIVTYVCHSPWKNSDEVDVCVYRPLQWLKVSPP